MYKNGFVWWKVILCVIISLIIISVSFILGRVSRNSEIKTLNSKIRKLNSESISNNSTNTKKENVNTTAKKANTKNEITEIKLNEPYVLSSDNGDYKITFEGIRETAERNQFSDINPNKVIFVDYNYENISSTSDVYISSIRYKVMDDSGNVLDTYPVSDDTRKNNSVPIGGKSKGTDAYAIMNDTKSITILYYDYGNKPLGKLVVNL